MASRLGRWLVAAAAAIVILGASIAPFLAPTVVRFEQDRVGAGQLTGLTTAELDVVTTSLLGDLVLWTGDFSIGTNGTPVLQHAERQHMFDVRRVFAGLWFLVLLGAMVLVTVARRTAGTEARAAMWRAVSNGARGLAVIIGLLGAVALVAFDAAFEIFHRLFFASGTYTFDPATSQLVRLFPDQFWFEITVAVGVVAAAVSLLTAWSAGRRANRAAPATSSIFAATRAGT